MIHQYNNNTENQLDMFLAINLNVMCIRIFLIACRPFPYRGGQLSIKLYPLGDSTIQNQIILVVQFLWSVESNKDSIKIIVIWI